MPTTAISPGATVAGRPHPQTTAEPAGGPFIRHAPSGRRPIYNQPATFGLFFGPPMVSSPGWNKGFRLKFSVGAGGASGATLNADAPFNEVQLLQLKDAWGTNLLAGPGWEMLYFVQKISGQFGWGATRDPRTLPPVLQMTLATLATSSYAGGTAPTTPGAPTIQLDADYYWLPNVPVDPPGIGTTCQYIFQPCNPVITSAGSLRVQLPRLGGYL